MKIELSPDKRSRTRPARSNSIKSTNKTTNSSKSCIKSKVPRAVSTNSTSQCMSSTSSTCSNSKQSRRRKCQVMCIACNKNQSSSLTRNSSLHSIASQHSQQSGSVVGSTVVDTARELDDDLEFEATCSTTSSAHCSSSGMDTPNRSISGCTLVDSDVDADANVACVEEEDAHESVETASSSSSSASSVCLSPPPSSDDEGTAVATANIQIAPVKSKTKRRVCFAQDVSTTTHDSQSSEIHEHGTNETPSKIQYPVQTDIIDIIKPASSMSEAERALAYWQLKDYEYFRGTAQIIASEVLKVTASQPPTSHSYNAVLTRAYDLCAVISESYFAVKDQEKALDARIRARDANALATTATTATTTTSETTATNNNQEVDNELEQEMIIPPHLFAALTHWVKAGHSRRGLEKFCVTSHIRSRPLAKAATVQAVLLAQDLLRQNNNNKQKQKEQQSTTSSNKNPTKFHIANYEFPLDLPEDEILRLVSERFSKTSRYYGTAIGHADAAAVGQYEHCDSLNAGTSTGAKTGSSNIKAKPMSKKKSSGAIHKNKK